MRQSAARGVSSTSWGPATLQATIGARIDRLDHAAKRTLNAAAVIGSRFDTDLLTSLVDSPDMAPLLDAGLVDQARVKPRLPIRPDSTRRGPPRRSGLAQQRTAGSREGSTSASATVGGRCRRGLSRPGRSAQCAGFATRVARLIALLPGKVPGLEGLRIQSWPRHGIQFIHTIFHGGVS
jgi:hypothetical protein